MKASLYQLGICLVFLLTVWGVGLLVGSPAEEPSAETVVVEESVEGWEEAIETYGGEEAYQIFAVQNQSLDIGTQHGNAHLFGEALYKTVGIEGVSVCDSRFAFGCYHSFFGFALLENGLGIMEDMDEACIRAYGNKGLGCQHGIGHGVLVELGPERLTDSLEACTRLQWKGPIGGCTSGVFMEYNFRTMETIGQRMVDETGWHHPCTAVSVKFLKACYFEQVAWWSSLLNDDYHAVGQRCEEVDDMEVREACYQGTGNVIAGMQEYSLPEIAQACTLMPTFFGEIRCIEGASWIVAHQPEHRDDWMELCAPYTGADRERCVRSKELI